MKCTRCNHEAEDARFKLCEHCRELARRSTAKWQEANREKRREVCRKSNAKCAKRVQRYLLKTREKRLKRQREYNHKNVERDREKTDEKNRVYYAEHKEEQFERVKRWMNTHPEEWKAIQHNRRTRINGNGGKFSAEEIRELANQQENKCFYCNNLFFNGDLNYDRHIEHKIPVSRGGSSDISNIVLSCSRCNHKKGTKTHEEFLQARSF